ncbi:neutral phospholipase A2 3-like [Uloborus diversus]|uniref:neutral phospholipase A2 3-like n=1 Tax=Uloborus diversus TaxID=327109 RepID=UPI002409C7FA|nr:neutral phospholipase A2 3-like [Uloborus diversus]
MSAVGMFLGMLLLIIPFGNAADGGGGAFVDKRQRRSIMNLNSMVQSATGHSGTDFVGYGNWCGLGGSGEPVDQIDGCCQLHDFCYNFTTRIPCRKFGEKSVYQLEYKWSTSEDGVTICDEESDQCKRTICMCDTILTHCLKKNMKFYDEKNLHKQSLLELLQEAEWLSER